MLQIAQLTSCYYSCKLVLLEASAMNTVSWAELAYIFIYNSKKSSRLHEVAKMVLQQVRKAVHLAPSPRKLDTALPFRETHVSQTGTAEGIYCGLEPRKTTLFNRAEQYFHYSDIVAIALDKKIITSNTITTVPQSKHTDGTVTCLPSTLSPSFRGTGPQQSRLQWSESAVGDCHGPGVLQVTYLVCCSVIFAITCQRGYFCYYE